MILHQGNKRIEFTIASYQYPEKKGTKEKSKEKFDYDANWLMCELKYADAEISEIYKDACLLTYELKEMTDAFSKILDGSEDGYISDFMEPYLKAAAARVDEKIVVIFQFVYDTTDGVWKDRKIKALLSQESATEMVQALKDLVSKYSER